MGKEFLKFLLAADVACGPRNCPDNFDGFRETNPEVMADW